MLLHMARPLYLKHTGARDNSLGFPTETWLEANRITMRIYPLVFRQGRDRRRTVLRWGWLSGRCVLSVLEFIDKPRFDLNDNDDNKLDQYTVCAQTPSFLIPHVASPSPPPPSTTISTLSVVRTVPGGCNSIVHAGNCADVWRCHEDEFHDRYHAWLFGYQSGSCM